MKSAWTSLAVGTALIVLLTVVAYIPAMHSGFIMDDDYVTNNRAFRSAEGLDQIWMNPNVTPQYYPLTYTAFWIEYHLWGLQPFGFHLVNVLLQAANAVLFWRLLSRLRVPGAWWAAAVFALHPVHVMSVAWITELKNVLSGFFFLSALIAYLRYCEPDNDGTAQSLYRRWAYKLALALFLCALLSKTSTSIMPVALLLILWWKKGRLARKELIPLVPFFVMGILFGGFTLWLEKHVKGATGQEFALPFVDRFLVAGRSFWFCLVKLVWPARLTFIYPRWQIDPTRGGPYLFPLGEVVLLVMLWRMRSRIGRAPFAALAYFTLAFPALVLVQMLYMMRYAFVSDHWQYLGSMSVIALGVSGAILALEHWAASCRRIGPVIGVGVLAALGLQTWQQTRIYHNGETLWRDTLAKNPDAWLARNNLGVILMDSGNVSEAKEYFEEALRLKPDYAEAHLNLGNALVREGKLTEAIGQYEQALRIAPDFAEAHHNLGDVLVRQGKLSEAIGHYERALQLKPDFAKAHYHLGDVLVRQGRLSEAIRQYEQALRLKPDDAGIHTGLGKVLLLEGDVQGSLTHFEQALKFNPDSAEVQNNLAWVLASLSTANGGNPARAVTLAERACKLTGNRVAGYLDTLGVAYAAAGRFDEATASAQKALELARSIGPPELVVEIQTHLELYRGGNVYRQPNGVTIPSHP